MKQQQQQTEGAAAEPVGAEELKGAAAEAVGAAEAAGVADGAALETQGAAAEAEAAGAAEAQGAAAAPDLLKLRSAAIPGGLCADRGMQRWRLRVAAELLPFGVGSVCKVLR